MASEPTPRSRRRRGRLPSTGWTEQERAYALLLDALTNDLVTAEATEVEMDSTSRRSPVDVRESQKQIARGELDEARDELGAFREALQDARTRSGREGRAEVAYDSALAAQDRLADVLIQYLVRPGYAEVRTEEPEPGHHVYYLRVDWGRLADLARQQGQEIVL